MILTLFTTNCQQILQARLGMSLTTVGSLQPKSSQSLLSTNTLRKTGRLATSLALGLSVCLLVSSKAEANTFEFQKVVDTNTPIPGVAQETSLILAILPWIIEM